VWVCDEPQQALAAIEEARHRYGDDATFVIEEKLEGQELSILGVTDGVTVRLLSPSQDHKQLLDGDQGPNTGGMGAFTPVPWVTPQMMQAIEAEVVSPTLAGLAAEGIAYRGVIYFGLMMTAQGPKLLEYNVRFGDPEAEVVLPKLAGSLAQLLLACAQGRLAEVDVSFCDGYFVDVVMVSHGYPDSYATGFAVQGLDAVSQETIIFHSGTRRDGQNLVTAGGRVLNVVCRGDSLEAAIAKVYQEVKKLSFQGAFYRTDIGQRRWPQ
jgi:phosphoribosylamine--glycine ligase